MKWNLLSHGALTEAYFLFEKKQRNTADMVNVSALQTPHCILSANPTSGATDVGPFFTDHS